MSPTSHERTIGRYAMFGQLAAGGMATVHFGRLIGPVGFSRTVAIKRLHAHFAGDSELASMFVDEARLAARIRHPNVVPTLDVVSLGADLFIVMEYVEGESLGSLCRLARLEGTAVPPSIAAAIMVGTLHGLHAAHEATTERGAPLDIVHRDVSPQNILVGVDGVARVLDFGIAKAAWRLQTTQAGQVKGKFPYMAPEQVQNSGVDRRLDIYAAGVVLWETLVGRRLFTGEGPAEIMSQVLTMDVPRPSTLVEGIGPDLDEVVQRAMARDPNERFANAREMASALERAIPIASQTETGAFVQLLARDLLAERVAHISAIERLSMIDFEERDDPGAPGAPVAPVVETPRVESADPETTRVASPGARPAASLRARVAVPGIMIALLVLALTGVIAARRKATPAAATPATVPSFEVVETVATVATAVPVQPALAASASPAKEPRPMRVAPPRTESRPKSKSCDPPFYVDARGIRRPKMECL